MRAILVASLVLASCGELSSGALAGATASPGATRAVASSATATPGATRSPTPTFSPTPSAVPISIGRDPAVGTIAGGPLGAWTYDGQSGALTALPEPTSTGTRPLSPSGRWSLEGRRVTAGPIIERVDLWLIDTATGAERLLYTPPVLPGKPATAQPNPNVPPYVFQRTEYAGPWSPDERYLAMWIVDAVGQSADRDGRPLAIIDVATGALTQLGPTLIGYTLAWRAPHTLAYVAGFGREHWWNKTLRIWTPETGSRDLTGPSEVGIKPAWGPDGRLWFVNGPSGDYDVPTYFGGRGVGDHSVVALDLGTGRRTRLPRVAGYADEGVRLSTDGSIALVLRRRLDPVAMSQGLGTKDDALELWSQRPDGASPRPLVRVCTSCGFGYYGGYTSLASLDWREPARSGLTPPSSP